MDVDRIPMSCNIDASMRFSKPVRFAGTRLLLRSEYFGALTAVMLLVHAYSSTTTSNLEGVIQRNGRGAVALCFAGSVSVLRQPTVRANIINFLARPLQASTFLHVGLKPDENGKHKRIFDMLPLHSRELEMIQEDLGVVSYAYQDVELDDAASFKCKEDNSTVEENWFVQYTVSHSAVVKHLNGCMRLVQRHEEKIDAKFEWVVLSRTDNLFLPHANTLSLLDAPHSKIFVDVTETESSFKISGRVLVMAREHVAGFLESFETLKNRPCGEFIIPNCTKKCAECMITSYWLNQPNVELVPLHDIIRHVPTRECGSQVDCFHIAKWIANDSCRNANATSKFSSQFCYKMRRYYGTETRTAPARGVLHGG